MGPLAGIKMIELAGLGPAPFAGMLLADMGAEVILVCLLYTSPSPRDRTRSRMPSSA